MDNSNKISQNRLLDILARERINKYLDDYLKNDSSYKYAQKCQRLANKKLGKLKLTKKQAQIVDKLISTVNQSGVAYGDVAYKQGLIDGIRLAFEIQKLN